MKIEENALIANSLGIESRCKVLAKLESVSDLSNLEALLKANSKYYILGEGTNIVPPSYFDGVVIKAEFNHIDIVNNILSVGASYNWTELVKFCIQSKINGFENLIDIPGSVGASPVQNIGAYGTEVSSLIDSIDCFCLNTFSKKNLTNLDCDFTYRKSVLKNSQYLIYNVNFISNLEERISYQYASVQKYIDQNSIDPSSLTIEGISNIISNVRSKVLPNPTIINNAGSFFKNPIISKNIINFNNFSEDELIIWNYSDDLIKVGAARLIELIKNNVEPSNNVSIHEHHSLVLVTNGNATQDEVLGYANKIIDLVFETFNIPLEIEPSVII
jgi:UDP-N-acetylmuramate dehydrogenase